MNKSKFAILLLLVALGAYVVHNKAEKPGTPTLRVPAASEEVTTKTLEPTPILLTIPTIHVTANVESVGLANGLMDVPSNMSNVAWYSLGVSPGEIGSAVITGHYGRKDGASSVFDSLYTLRPGDKVYTQDDAGIQRVFVVRELRRYAADADATDIFSPTDGGAHLNLITCEGAWNSKTEQYPTRLVVFTDLE